MDQSTKGRVVAFKTEEKEKFMRSSGVTSKMGYYCEGDIKESQILTKTQI